MKGSLLFRTAAIQQIEFLHFKVSCIRDELPLERVEGGGAGRRVEDRGGLWTSCYMSLNSVSLFTK